MTYIVQILFFLLFVFAFIGVFLERAVIMKKLSQHRNIKVNLAYTQKQRFKNLEEYRTIVENENGNLISYWILHGLYSHGQRYVVFLILLVIISFMF